MFLKDVVINFKDKKPRVKEHRGYPCIEKYKYLGVLINCKLNNLENIYINNEIKVYQKRNNWIIQKNFFSSRSLLKIYSYFVKSRLLYEASCYVDLEK